VSPFASVNIVYGTLIRPAVGAAGCWVAAIGGIPRIPVTASSDNTIRRDM
jgi:hypothetical protein